MNGQLIMQGILGGDMKNPYYTVERRDGLLYVYLGMALMEVVPDDKQNPNYKLLIGRLFNSGLRKKSITESFGITYSTMRRWGDALTSNDAEILARVLAGPGAPLKVTKSVKEYVEMRFWEIYEKTHYGYSNIIRQEVNKIFSINISGETLRPVFASLKQRAAETNNKESKIAATCDSEIQKAGSFATADLAITEKAIDTTIAAAKANRKYALTFPKQGQSLLCNHAGVLLFSSLINRLTNKVESHSNLVVQWLMSILLGMVNIEQTKLIDSDSLKAMLGTFIKSLKQQRVHLMKLATKEVVANLIAFNLDLVQCAKHTDFYYDPHTKQYTGMQNILKGWCGSSHGIAKILNMDFIHTAAGDPVYVKHTDNFFDLRERYIDVIDEFRKVLQCDKKTVQTFVIDRGIYGLEVFKDIISRKSLNLITWEKGYKRNLWADEKVDGSFSMTRPRNHAHDLFRYEFSYIDQPWDKDNRMKQIIVRATNPNNKTIEVAILATDKKRAAEEIIRLIFKRWLQENDFKYLIKHYGINEITNYTSTPYFELRDLVTDKQIISARYKAMKMNEKDVKNELSKLLLKEHTKKKDNQERKDKIAKLTSRLSVMKKESAQEEKEVSRLETLIAEKYFRLDTDGKSLLDIIKLIARNMFYQTLEPFKVSYNNYRDDHAIFRNLTRSAGILINNDDSLTVLLMPTVSYETKVREIVESFLDFVNQTNPVLPDGSNRKIVFKLSKKSNNLFAISDDQK